MYPALEFGSSYPPPGDFILVFRSGPSGRKPQQLVKGIALAPTHPEIGHVEAAFSCQNRLRVVFYSRMSVRLFALTLIDAFGELIACSSLLV